MSRTTHRTALFAALILAGSMAAATAQTTTPSASPSAPVTTPTPSTSADLGGSLTKSHNAWRSTKLDGATVYNEQGNSIGTIDDMLLDSQGMVSNVVLSVGGFLGLGSKYVEVPFSKLQFMPSKAGNNSGSGNGEYSVVLPGVTKDALNAMTSFSY